MEYDCWEGEHVLGKWPSRCRKLAGKLVLTATRLVHVPDLHDEQNGRLHSRKLDTDSLSDRGNPLEIQLTGARSVKLEISKKRPGFDEALVRLSNLPTPPGKLVIEFTCPENKWAHLSELSEWMRAREEEAKRLEDEQRQEAETLGEQLRSVWASPDLRQQYQYLVKQAGILTSSEFLKQHAQEISLLKPLPEAPVVDLAPLRVVAAAHKSDRTVSQEDRVAIFKELPALCQLHSATVPSMMTEAEFWERCLKSRYYLLAAGKDVPASHPEDRLFDSLTSPETSQPVPSVQTMLSHLEADLTGEFEADKPSKKRRTTATLISRLNERSAGATAMEGGPRSGPESGDVDRDLRQAVEKRRSELRQVTKTFQEDLAATAAAPQPPRLQLKAGAGALSAMSSLPEKDRVDVTAQDSEASKATPTTWPSKCSARCSEAGTRWVLKHSTDELLAAERLLPGSSGDTHVVTPEPVTRAVTLLRHFWSSRVTEKGMRAKLAGEAHNVLNMLTEIGTGAGVAGRHKAAMARSVIPALQAALDLHASTSGAAGAPKLGGAHVVDFRHAVSNKSPRVGFHCCTCSMLPVAMALVHMSMSRNSAPCPPN
ncbi:Tfb1 [Symbiodinium sp. CCMP2456]|nr:Tfb1 [Symbiodinium sp. CCMP2456]